MSHLQASAIPSSGYLTALTQEIEKKLQRALTSQSQRINLLQELFADVALEVDERAREIMLSKNESGICAVDDENGSRLCFYDLLADHYVDMPEDGKPALNLFVQLWSQSFASNIFALLFHKWLFEVEHENSEILLRYSSALVQGATNVFWIDIQTNSRRFFSLFHYLLEDVALVSTRLNKIPMQAQRDLYLLLSRFLFFYNLDDKLDVFLKHFPTLPNAFLVGGPADIFIIELTDQLQKLKVEPVLIHYLSRMRVLQGLELRMTTSTRLKACLYSFTSPGGPMYPTRAVRHAAWDTLDLLFPVGRYPRHLISLFFRLLYPWYWPSSCWNFVASCITAIVYSLLRLIFGSWDSIRRRTKNS
ncbi:hypothetical protein Scep_003790 [Stephania cephalantha]|uniref:K-stimulated pyrophosphate-energized sodium pump protein n=1 Tax=Stephania cephalantha TaxID=152367 RepID=A0AAP0KRA1_9MAGN